MGSYSKILQHPLWQEKRREILELRDYTCERCGGHPDSLDIHHGYYESGKKPWEYPNDTLRALCRPCHLVTEHELTQLRREIGLLDPSEIATLTGLARRLLRRDPDEETHNWLARGRSREQWSASSEGGQARVNGVNQSAGRVSA